MYRIPTVITAINGTLLAFCEGRQSLFDLGDIDVVMKTSTDGGKTWSPLKVIWNDGKNTCGNPSAVIDIVSGDIVLLATLNNGQVMVMRSTDGGSHWTGPKDITNNVKPANWLWYATGPVHGIQLEHSRWRNRLVIACNHTINGATEHIAHIIYSDDGGYSWTPGGSVPCIKTDECTVAELSNGQLLLNMRNNDRVLPDRKISYSTDGGTSWSACVFDTALTEPVCQGALLSYKLIPHVILFSNPANKKARKQLTLSISYDEGKTWNKKLLLCKGPSAYSDLAVTNNGDVVCLYESGRYWPYGGIALLKIESSKISR